MASQYVEAYRAVGADVGSNVLADADGKRLVDAMRDNKAMTPTEING